MTACDIPAAVFIMLLLIGLFCDVMLHWQLGRKKLFVTAMATLTVIVVFTRLYGLSPFALRCILICQLMILAGVTDAATYEIPDRYPICIFVAGLFGCHVIPALCGCLLIPLPFLIGAWKTGKIGGGDVKLTAAGGFILGVSGGICMLITGLFAAILWNLVLGGKKQSIPLAPFLAFGCFVALQLV